MFQISQLRRIPSQYGHLAGLLEIFKEKLVSLSLLSVVCIHKREDLKGSASLTVGKADLSKGY